MHEHLAILDTTLRDGLQTPGLPAISKDQRLEIALMLERLGVDVIEAGFPVSSDVNFESVRAIAQAVKNSTVCALSLATQESVECAARALSSAHRPRLHLFLGSSKTHLEKLSLCREEMLERTGSIIRFASRHFGEIQFSPEDAGRTDMEFLAEVAAVAIEAGARVINIPDTVGHCMPREYGERMQRLIQEVPGAERVTWSVHCHDDYGCATANSLEGVLAGARQVECTLYNIGERAGNTALEEVVMAVRKRQDTFPCDTRINTPLLWEAAHLVEKSTGVAIPCNKAVVGRNAFSHESGIHQAGVLKNRASYEVMSPGEVGWQGRHLPLGPQSGSRAFRARMIELGIELNHNQFAAAFRQFKAYADANGPVSDDVLRRIAEPLLIASVA